MDSISAARSMRGSLGMFAMSWLMAPSTREKSKAAGMGDGMGAYSVGLLGVLGYCPVDNVVAAALCWDASRMR